MHTTNILKYINFFNGGTVDPKSGGCEKPLHPYLFLKPPYIQFMFFIHSFPLKRQQFLFILHHELLEHLKVFTCLNQY